MKLKTEVTLSVTEVAKAIKAYMKGGGWEIKGPVEFTIELVSDNNGSHEEFSGCRFTVEDWEGPDIMKKK